MSATAEAEIVDLAVTPLRELNQRLHDVARDRRRAARAGGSSTRVAPMRSRAGSTPSSRSRSTGTSGYYCAGMNKQATVRVRGNASTGIAENMMSGRHRRGQRQPVGRGDRPRRTAGRSRRRCARCGISMKGVEIVVRGSVGH